MSSSAMVTNCVLFLIFVLMKSCLTDLIYWSIKLVIGAFAVTLLSADADATAAYLLFFEKFFRCCQMQQTECDWTRCRVNISRLQIVDFTVLPFSVPISFSLCLNHTNFCSATKFSVKATDFHSWMLQFSSKCCGWRVKQENTETWTKRERNKHVMKSPNKVVIKQEDFLIFSFCQWWRMMEHYGSQFFIFFFFFVKCLVNNVKWNEGNKALSIFHLKNEWGKDSSRAHNKVILIKAN